MLEDAYKEILSLVKSNEKVSFIAIDRYGKVTVSTIESLRPNEFKSIQDALEFIEKI